MKQEIFVFTKAFAFIFLFGSVIGCALPPPTPPKTQLQIRQAQTREYSTPPGGTRQVMKAVISTLQDSGFIIKNADKDLGFITAQKETDIEGRWDSFFAHLGASQGVPARYNKNSIVECSINISEFGENIRVRANFQRKVLDNLGGTRLVVQVNDAKFYQEFFAKIDKGIFIERQGL